MKRKILLITTVFLLGVFITGCSNKQDCVDIFNKSCFIFDNINIDLPPGYFYEKHEKFTVDESAIGLTIYFSNKTDEWD